MVKVFKIYFSSRNQPLIFSFIKFNLVLILAISLIDKEPYSTIINISLNLSISDGWWDEEAKDGENGWIIGDKNVSSTDEEDAESIYNKLEKMHDNRKKIESTPNFF